MVAYAMPTITLRDEIFGSIKQTFAAPNDKKFFTVSDLAKALADFEGNDDFGDLVAFHGLEHRAFGVWSPSWGTLKA